MAVINEGHGKSTLSMDAELMALTLLRATPRSKKRLMVALNELCQNRTLFRRSEDQANRGRETSWTLKSYVSKRGALNVGTASPELGQAQLPAIKVVRYRVNRDGKRSRCGEFIEILKIVIGDQEVEFARKTLDFSYEHQWGVGLLDSLGEFLMKISREEVVLDCNSFRRWNTI